MPHLHTAATEAQIADFQRYASTIITIGVDPDNPDRPKLNVALNIAGRRPLCLALQAALLRDAALELAKLHGPDRC
ncbi:hypothetical protein [Rhodococcus aetherivorans]|uniref:hypothetical protein n=1 Tax=Rhodococcus aetherivorans TaxID=191292 RepID=UPI00389087FF